MKIGIDIRSLSGDKYGGVGEYIRNLLPEMFKAGSEHTFHLFYNSRSDRGDFLEFKGSNVELHKFSYPNKLLTFAGRYFKLPHIDKLIGGVDIFFSPHFIPVPVSASCKKVITFHDLSFEYFPEYFNRRRRLWHKYMNPRQQAQAADHIIAVSESTKNDLVDKYNIEPQDITMIHSGVCDFVINPPHEKWSNVKKKYGLRNNYILSLSTIEPRKNIVALIRAFNLLKNSDIYLVIAGAKGWSYRDIFKEAEKSPKADKIIFTGPVEEREKYFLYKNASVFVYPSLYEGFGFPPLEAMHTGTPTVASMTTSLPEITQSAAILINPYVPADIAAAIEDIIEDSRLASMLSEKGKETADSFRWQKTANETLKVLEQIQIR
ncbi:MAG: glycosyltransferase family 1 protein [Candidatus Spechtbacterales bacterium]|nr:glycosyltransferase family 1 protein [Candidatus Spechtbacterales bacterium]